MDVLKKLLFLSFLSLCCGCAKFSYVLEQGVGQLGLFSASRPNQVLLTDEKVDPVIRDKIKRIEELKEYFYQYWERPSTRIYERTTMLERDQVTTLVIASPFDQIEPRKECFWLVGCFPYLGFYKEKSANRYAEKLESQGYVTFLRPVYAYSTLGYLHDPILSSFFHFEDFDLTELVFHEIYHTIFFAKNEVDLNENLANYMAKEMTFEYFKMDEKERLIRERREAGFQLLREKMVQLTAELNQIYRDQKPETKAQAGLILEKFKTERLRPFFKNYCEQLEIGYRQCFPLNRDWNNANLAAFLTYEKRAESLSILREKKGFTLKALQLYIESKYHQYQKSKKKNSFEDFLFSEVE